jgi:hypothetical protein
MNEQGKINKKIKRVLYRHIGLIYINFNLFSN